jgi:hypothetical protein
MRRNIGCGGLALSWGSIAFLVVGIVWWLATGREPRELWYWYLGYCGFVIFNMVYIYVDLWRDESKETAKTVKELLERLTNVEQAIGAIKKQAESLGSHLDQFKSEFDEFAESIREDARQGLSQIESIEERVRNLDAK